MGVSEGQRVRVAGDRGGHRSFCFLPAFCVSVSQSVKWG